MSVGKLIDLDDRLGKCIGLDDRLGKLIGIDHGLKRVGIAISDENRDFVWTREVAQTSIVHKVLKELIENEGPVGIVVGMPYMLDGREGEQCVAVRKFIQELKEYWPGKVFLFDERMSTRIVKVLYNSDSDSDVARCILESFLGL